MTITPGAETRVNTHTDQLQAAEKVAALADGGWVVVWQSGFQDGDGNGVHGQVFNADGSPRGNEFQINTYTVKSQDMPEIIGLKNGGWVVTWRSYEQDGSLYGVYSQAYNANGSKLGGEVQVNTTTFTEQHRHKLVELEGGGWVVVWESSSSNANIHMQVFNANGTKRGGEVEVNTHLPDWQTVPQVTALKDGGWVVTWVSSRQDLGTSDGVFCQVFNADGSTRGEETQVNTEGLANQNMPQVAALSDGGWVPATELRVDLDLVVLWCRYYTRPSGNNSWLCN